jgi:YD repeat-containing protein
MNRLPVDNELALLLAIEAGNQADTFEANSALRETVATTSQVSNNILTMKVVSGHSGWVIRVAWDPEGKRIVTASSDGTARIWEVPSGKETHVLTGHTGAVLFAAWDPSGRRIVTTGMDGIARIWEAESGIELARLDPRGSFMGGLTQSVMQPGIQVVNAWRQPAMTESRAFGTRKVGKSFLY